MDDTVHASSLAGDHYGHPYGQLQLHLDGTALVHQAACPIGTQDLAPAPGHADAPTQGAGASYARNRGSRYCALRIHRRRAKGQTRTNHHGPELQTLHPRSPPSAALRCLRVSITDPAARVYCRAQSTLFSNRTPTSKTRSISSDLCLGYNLSNGGKESQCSQLTLP